MQLRIHMHECHQFFDTAHHQISTKVNDLRIYDNVGGQISDKRHHQKIID